MSEPFRGRSPTVRGSPCVGSDWKVENGFTSFGRYQYWDPPRDMMEALPPGAGRPALHRRQSPHSCLNWRTYFTRKRPSPGEGPSPIPPYEHDKLSLVYVVFRRGAHGGRVKPRPGLCRHAGLPDLDFRAAPGPRSAARRMGIYAVGDARAGDPRAVPEAPLDRTSI